MREKKTDNVKERDIERVEVEKDYLSNRARKKERMSVCESFFKSG